MTCNKDTIEIELKKLLKHLERKSKWELIRNVGKVEFDRKQRARDIDVDDIIPRLYKQFPNDVGVFCPFVLNTFTCVPGQAIFLSPNVPHAYLSGDIIEVMACSDNVVRAGLTPKPRDTDTLCTMLTYNSGYPYIRSGKKLDDNSRLYEVNNPLTINEFSLTRTQLNKSQNYVLKHVNTPSLLLLYEGSAVLSPVVSEKSSETLSVSKGATLLIPAKVDLKMQGGEDGAILFRCCSR